MESKSESVIAMISLALTVLCLAASAAATGYIDGHEYVYQYDGAIYTGYPKVKPQEAGYVYNVKLIVQPQGDHAIFRIEDPKNARFNAEFEDVVRGPHEYTGLPPEGEILTRPFRVTRKNGIVTQFEVDADEPSFSVNLKRGIVSLFNLNFGQSDVIDNEVLKTDPDAHFYKVYEESPVGNCETAYIIQHHPYEPSNNHVLNVTKVRDFHKCRFRPNQLYGREYHGYSCGKNQYDRSHTLHGNAYYNYSIRGDRQSYVIEKITFESDTSYTPYPMNGGRVSTIIRRVLTLVEERPASEQSSLSGNLVAQNSLMYDFNFQRDFKGPVDLTKPHFLYHLTGRKVPLADVRKQIDELLDVYNDESFAENIKDRNFPAKFIELLRSASTLAFSDFEELYATYANIPDKGASREQELARSLFIDVISNIGTNPALLFGKELIEQKKARPAEAEQFLRESQFHVKEVSEVLLDKYQELCESDYVRKRTTLHLVCVHGLANIVYDACVSHFHPDDLQHQITKNICPYEQAVKYFNYIAGLYEQATDETVKMSLIQAAGKLGVKESLPYLVPYVTGEKTHNRLQRDNAIWSVQNVGWRNKEKIRGLLVPLVYNRSEATELRMSAFTVLLQYQPGMADVEAMTRALKYDPDDELRSYVYSAYKYIGSSTHLCDRNQSYIFQYALRLLEDVKHEFEEYDYSFSKLTFNGVFDPEYSIGGSFKWVYYMNNNGWFPRKMYAAFENTRGGLSAIESGYSFRQYGLEKFLDKLFGPEGTLGKRSVFDLFKKRGKRDVSNARKELNEIKSKMNLPVYEYDEIEGEFFLNYLTHKTYSWYFNEKTFEQFFKGGRFIIPNIPASLQNIPESTRQHFSLTTDKFYVMPTETGLPFFFDYKQPVYCYHKNKQSSFRVEPGFFPEDRGGQWPDHVKFETDGHVAIDKNLIANMGVMVPFDQVTFGGGVNERLTVSLPLKVKLDLDVKEKKLKTLWTPVPHEVLHFKYEPFTFVDSYANTVPEILEPGYKPVRKIKGYDVTKRLFHDQLGVGFDIRSSYDNAFNDFGNFVSFATKRGFLDIGHYLVNNPNLEPYGIDVQLGYASQGATKEVGVDLTYQSHEDNWVIPHFAEENFEDYDKQRENRGPVDTRAVKVDVRGTGDKERKIHAVATLTRDLLRTFYKLNFFYERTPFSSSETQPLKICGSSYLRYPRNDLKRLAALDTVDMDHTVNTELRVNFGKNCNSDQKIKIKGLIQETEEQHELETQREQPDTPEHYNLYSKYYHQCQEERSRGINYGHACMEYMDLATTLHKYTFNIKHENLSRALRNLTYHLGHVIKLYLYPWSDTNELDVQNPADELLIEAAFNTKRPAGDIRVRTPTYNVNFLNVPFQRYAGFSSYPMYEDVLVKKSLTDTYCSIEKDQVYTFDRYTYTLPPTDCDKVIAKDCSPQEYFTVLGKDIKHSRYQKAVKVLLGDHKIEALPVSEDSEIIVRIDGQRVPIANYEPYVQREGDETLFYITYRDFYYALHSQKYGLIVEYDGNAIFVQASPYYKAKLCGLCGNGNHQRFDKAINARGCYYKDGKDYAYSYAVQDGTCTAPRPEPICPAEGGFGCYRLKTKVVQLTTGKVPLTCFSTVPVSECSVHCHSPGMVSRKLSFHCLAAADDSTKALVRESEYRILYELSRKNKDHENTVEVPDGCYRK